MSEHIQQLTEALAKAQHEAENIEAAWRSARVTGYRELDHETRFLASLDEVERLLRALKAATSQTRGDFPCLTGSQLS